MNQGYRTLQSVRTGTARYLTDIVQDLRVTAVQGVHRPRGPLFYSILAGVRANGTALSRPFGTGSPRSGAQGNVTETAEDQNNRQPAHAADKETKMIHWSVLAILACEGEP